MTMDMNPIATKTCSFCGEDVRIDAKKCKHCGETIDVALRAAEEARRAAEKGAAAHNPMVFMNAGGGGGASSSSSSSSAAAAAGGGYMAPMKPPGSIFWLIFWMLGGFVFPIVPGIIYYFSRSWPWQHRHA